MKIAYLFIVYNKPLDVFNLVRLLDNGKNTFFIHFKKGVSFTVPDDIKTKVNVIFAKKRFKAGWAGFKVIEATIHLMQLAFESEYTFDYYINMSGSCFPVYSNSIIEKKLKTIQHSVIEGIKIPNPSLQNEGLPKIIYPWFQDELQNCNRYLKKYFHKILHVFLKIINLKRKFPAGYDPYFGSQWWALTQEAVVEVLQSYTNNKLLYIFFKRVWASDEQYIQTVVYNSPRLEGKLINQPFRYIDWNTNGPPKTLTILDYQKILQSDRLFARKIDSVISDKLIHQMLSNT
jgi:hypothetical protein